MPDVIVLDQVSKRLGKRRVLNDVGFTVSRGDIFGYLGPNGAGKTTTIRILLGLMRPGSGVVTVLGKDASSAEARPGIGFLLEADGLYDSLSAQDNLDYYARIYGVRERREAIRRSLAAVKLEDRARDKVATYSKGMRQRLALARAMVHSPDLLVLDEPTAGVDPTGQMEVRQIILDMARNEGKTVFLSSHNLDEVQRICNRIALIHRGEIRLCGERDKLQREMGRGRVLFETAGEIAGPVLGELQKLPGVAIQDRSDGSLTVSLGKEVDIADIVLFLTQRKVRLQQVKRLEASLEEIYTSILRDAEEQKQ